MIVPDFYLHIKCMYDMMALRQGVDPDNPPKIPGDSSTAKPQSRKVSGPEAALLLRELAQIKEKAKEEKVE